MNTRVDRARELELACRAAREAGWLPARVDVACTFYERLIGLRHAGRRRRLAADPCVLAFPRCKSVHTWTMRLPIDIAFYDADGRIVDCFVCTGPRRVLTCADAWGVLERVSPAARPLARGEPDFQKSFAFSLDRSF